MIFVRVKVKVRVSNVRASGLDLNEDHIAAGFPIVRQKLNRGVDPDIRRFEGPEDTAGIGADFLHECDAAIAGLRCLRVLCRHPSSARLGAGACRPKVSDSQKP